MEYKFKFDVNDNTLFQTNDPLEFINYISKLKGGKKKVKALLYIMLRDSTGIHLYYDESFKSK